MKNMLIAVSCVVALLYLQTWYAHQRPPRLPEYWYLAQLVIIPGVLYGAIGVYQLFLARRYLKAYGFLVIAGILSFSTPQGMSMWGTLQEVVGSLVLFASLPTYLFLESRRRRQESTAS